MEDTTDETVLMYLGVLEVYIGQKLSMMGVNVMTRESTAQLTLSHVSSS